MISCEPEWRFAHGMRIVVEKREVRMAQRLENVPESGVRHRQKSHARVSLRGGKEMGAIVKL